MKHMQGPWPLGRILLKPNTLFRSVALKNVRGEHVYFQAAFQYAEYHWTTHLQPPKDLKQVVLRVWLPDHQQSDSFRNFLEMQILGSHPRSTKSENLVLGSSNHISAIIDPPGYVMHANVWEPMPYHGWQTELELEENLSLRENRLS